jgi:transposase
LGSAVKKTTRYAEARRYEKDRKRFLKRLYKAIQEKRDIVHLDETGFAPTIHRTHGWAFIGQKIYGDKPGQKRPRTSLIGGYLRNKLIAPMLFDGTCCQEVFNEWLASVLLPQLKRDTVIVLDNATFHKSQLTIDLVRMAGCTLLFLPPYSPHLNPIEKLWANIKRIWAYAENKTLMEVVKSCG